jgi:hypothetical protein
MFHITIPLLKTLAHKAATVVYFISLKLLILFSTIPIVPIETDLRLIYEFFQILVSQTSSCYNITVRLQKLLYTCVEAILPFSYWKYIKFKRRQTGLITHLSAVNTLPSFGNKQADFCVCVCVCVYLCEG